MAVKHWHSVVQHDGVNEDETFYTYDTQAEADAGRDGFVLEYTIGFTGRQHSNRVQVQPNGTIAFIPEDPHIATVEYLTWECTVDHDVDLAQEYESLSERLAAIEAALTATAVIANDSGWPEADTMRLAATMYVRLKRDKATFQQRLADIFDQMTHQ